MSKVHPCRRLLIVQPDFFGNERFLGEYGRNVDCGGQEQQNGSSGSEQKYTAAESDEGVLAQANANTDRAVLARAVVVGLGSGIEGRKQNESEQQQPQGACRNSDRS